jgi:hypothetical protein
MVLQGRGRLAPAQRPNEQFDVEYRIGSLTSRRTSQSGPPSIEVQSRSSGEIRALNGRATPEGIYMLTTDDGEILKVTNPGGSNWRLLSEEV